MIRNISFSIWNKKLKIEDTQVELDENILDESVSLDEKISRATPHKVHKLEIKHD